MSKRFWIVRTAALALCTASAFAQQSGDQQTAPPPQQSATNSSQQSAAPPSLGEAARRAREQKKAEGKASKTFDNDNLPAQGGVNVVGAENAPAAAGNSGATPANATATTAPAADNAAAAANATPSGSDEAGWRKKFAKAREKLQRDQAELDVLQREMGKVNVQYYSDPVKGMQQSISQQDVNDKRAAIDKKKADVAADQAALTDLEDQLRKAGGDIGWSR